MSFNRIALISFVSILFISSCSHNSRSNNVPKSLLDTSMIESSTDIKIDSLKALSSFYIGANYLHLDDYLKAYLTNPNVEVVSVSEEFCWDHLAWCSKYILTEDPERNEKLHVFKSNFGKESFNNEQYFFRGDTLKMVRVFNYSVDEDSSKHIQYITSEDLYFFSPDKTDFYSRSLNADTVSYAVNHLKFAHSTYQSDSLADIMQQIWDSHFTMEHEIEEMKDFVE